MLASGRPKLATYWDDVLFLNGWKLLYILYIVVFNYEMWLYGETRNERKEKKANDCVSCTIMQNPFAMFTHVCVGMVKT